MIDPIRCVGRRYATSLLPLCERGGAIASHGRRRRAVLGARSRRAEHAWGQRRYGRRRRAVPGTGHWREVLALRWRTAEPRSAQNDPCLKSGTVRDRFHLDCRRCVPKHHAGPRCGVRVWRCGRRDTTRIESLPRLSWAHERAVSHRSRRDRQPREVVRGAFDEREESLRPRASLPVTLLVLVGRQR
jgi:hypothetical protein